MRGNAEAEGAASIEAGKQQGGWVETEATEVRQGMVDVLANLGQALRQQIEQLQAGRDRLSAAYDIVRETLAVATEELHVALPEGRLSAEVASLQSVDSELEATITPIITAEELDEPTIAVFPASQARNVETPGEARPSAP